MTDRIEKGGTPGVGRASGPSRNSGVVTQNFSRSEGSPPCVDDDGNFSVDDLSAGSVTGDTARAAYACHERANSSIGWTLPLSAALRASKYLSRAWLFFRRLVEPQVNIDLPSFTISTSAIRRACLPLPFGNG